MNPLSWLIKIFSGNAVGNAVGKAATSIGVIAALAPLAIWLVANKDEQFICISYGELAFFGGILAMNLLIAYSTRAGSAYNRQDFN